jgi:hypothetical protein
VRLPIFSASALLTVAAILLRAGAASAQPAEPTPPADEPGETTPPSEPEPAPAPPPPEPTITTAPPPQVEVLPPVEEPKPKMSEGRMLVSLYNVGFQWGISPGIVFSRGKAGFALGLRFGYGVDAGPVIVVPGVRLTGYFIDPNVYLGMPTVKLVLPIDRFGPFIEGGAGVGHVSEPSKTGLGLLAGGGLMVYFTRVAFGAEASYQVITGTSFKGFGIGPILALGF